jgi:hypothetical protein
MSERGRARGRGRSRPAVPGEASSEPSGAAGITAPTGEVLFFTSIKTFELIIIFVGTYYISFSFISTNTDCS